MDAVEQTNTVLLAGTGIKKDVTVLEEQVRLSRSILWQVQRKFFENQGIEAWRQGIVPHYITCNPRIANAYANVVYGFLRDCCASTDSTTSLVDLGQPLYIIELGAGSGRFSYHFLKKFNDFFQQSTLKNIPIQYVMTDFAERTVDYWRTHPSLKPFVESGLLDFALFDAENPGDLRLLSSGKVLAAGTVKNPMVVIANYFFDGIPQDSFSNREGVLYENLVSLVSSQFESDLGAADLLKRIEITYTAQPMDTDYYDNPLFNQVLQTYKHRLAGTTFTFPYAALQCIHHFNSLTEGGLMLLSADKGYYLEESLLDQEKPDLRIHGSFSMMVNYHAVAEYTALLGCKTLQTSHRDTSLCIAAFLFGKPSHHSIETSQAFHEVIEKDGPDDFFMIKKALENQYDKLSLQQILAYLRLSGWDASIFMGVFPSLLAQLEAAPSASYQELYQAVRKIWDLYYPIGEENDLAFQLAMLLQAMGFYPEALEFYNYSLQFTSPDVSTFYNMGICHYMLRQLGPALEDIQHALELNPVFDEAKVMRIKLQSELSNLP